MGFIQHHNQTNLVKCVFECVVIYVTPLVLPDTPDMGEKPSA